MASFERAQLEDWVERWLQVNRDAEKAGDWKPLADFYTDDATYGWNIGPKEDVMCVGIDEIRDIALGLEMEGLGNWTYPYQKVIIDDKQGEVVGFWKQVVGGTDKADGDTDADALEVYGIGGSWFRLADVDGEPKIEWQRDFFDFGHVQKLYLKLMENGRLSEGMQKRIERALAGEKLPGYYPLGEAPVPIW
ncbi:nuclear transport factor 2 family protein [Mycolicibacterium wolinskyi]|uniref:nuclear transport factor 2 family protein n=1 Tax=Mycolicibacterium wolinskyi TaxID=59750 RepID=UPI003917A984